MMVRAATTERARELRRAATPVGRKLWPHLRDRQLASLKFHRQCPIGRSIVDFVCHDARVVVEVDGSQHAGSAADQIRDTLLQANGYRIVRVWNNEIRENIEGVLAAACGRGV